MEQSVCERTRVAVLGTFADLLKEPFRDDLRWLEHLVEKIEPDLLCASIRQDHWEQGDREALALEYREVLVPLAERTNIVIVPVCGATSPNLRTRRTVIFWSLCSAILRGMQAALRMLQSVAGIPETIHAKAYGRLCDLAGTFSTWVCDGAMQEQWAVADREVIENVLQAVRRDPGRRMLVTMDCQRCHSLRRLLRQVPEIELVDFWKL